MLEVEVNAPAADRGVSLLVSCCFRGLLCSFYEVFLRALPLITSLAHNYDLNYHFFSPYFLFSSFVSLLFVFPHGFQKFVTHLYPFSSPALTCFCSFIFFHTLHPQHAHHPFVLSWTICCFLTSPHSNSLSTPFPHTPCLPLTSLTSFPKTWVKQYLQMMLTLIWTV